MGLLKFDRTSRIHRIVFETRKNYELRKRWKNDFDGLAKDYGLNDVEIKALKELDVEKWRELGVHPFYYQPIIRLFHGEDFDEFQSHIVGAMTRAYGAVADPETYRPNHLLAANAEMER
jgi:Aromatic-ring-opening dioxygenase LigAB, LigA subunit